MKLPKLTFKTSTFVIAVVIAGLCAGWAREAVGRLRAQRRYQDAVLARLKMETEVVQLRTEREELTGALATSEQHATELDQRLAAKDTELKLALDRLAKEQEAIQDLQAKMVAIQYQFDRVQGELAVAMEQRAAGPTASATNAVRLDKVVVTQPGSGAPGLEGRILSVNSQWNFVVVDLGWSVVELGDVVSIYHGDDLVAKARVERVQEQVAAATLLPEWAKSDIQVNDVVRIL